VKRTVSQSNQSKSASSSSRYKYNKVLNNRKHPIRGLWRRNGKFRARISVEDEAGRNEVRWVPLTATTAAEAQDEFRTLMVARPPSIVWLPRLSPSFHLLRRNEWH